MFGEYKTTIVIERGMSFREFKKKLKNLNLKKEKEFELLIELIPKIESFSNFKKKFYKLLEKYAYKTKKFSNLIIVYTQIIGIDKKKMKKLFENLYEYDAKKLINFYIKNRKIDGFVDLISMSSDRLLKEIIPRLGSAFRELNLSKDEWKKIGDAFFNRGRLGDAINIYTNLVGNLSKKEWLSIAEVCYKKKFFNYALIVYEKIDYGKDEKEIQRLIYLNEKIGDYQKANELRKKLLSLKWRYANT